MGVPRRDYSVVKEDVFINLTVNELHFYGNGRVILFTYSRMFWRHLSNLLFIIQLLMPNHHAKLHDWAARPNAKNLCSLVQKLRMLRPLYRRRGGPSKSTPMFGGQIRDDGFGKQSVNTHTSCQIGWEHRRCPWKCAGEPETVNSSPCTRTRIFADFNLANFALGLGPASVQDPTDPGAQS